MDYQVVKESSQDRFVRAVKQQLLAGWQCIGGVSVAVLMNGPHLPPPTPGTGQPPGAAVLVYAQAMMKEK